MRAQQGQVNAAAVGFMKDTPMYQLYQRVAHHGLRTSLGSAPPSYYVEVFKLLGGGLRDGGWMGEGRPKGGHALAILPGLNSSESGDPVGQELPGAVGAR